MIKTFVAKSPEEIDTQVNSFMKERKKNLPVRTETYTIGNNLTQSYFVATVFYDEIFENKTENNIEYKEIENKPEPKNKSIGALWKYGDNYKGSVNDKQIILPDTDVSKYEKITTKDGEMYKGTLGGFNVLIIKNKFKTEKKHPDLIIYSGDKK